MMKISRFDVILVFILTFAVALIVVDVWLKLNGYTELTSYVWTFAGTITGGEIVAFSLYQIAKEISSNSVKSTNKALGARHSFLNQLIEEDKQKEVDDGRTGTTGTGN